MGGGGGDSIWGRGTVLGIGIVGRSVNQFKERAVMVNQLRQVRWDEGRCEYGIMVSGLGGTNYEEKLKELGLTTLEERRHQADMLQAYKIITGKDNVQRESWFKMAAEGVVRTRQAAGLMNVVKPRSRLEVRSNFFSVRVTDGWNLVPEEIKMARSAGLFKRLYKTHRSSLPWQ